MKKQENVIHQEKRNITETHTDTQVLEHFKDEAFKIPLNMFKKLCKKMDKYRKKWLMQ